MSSICARSTWRARMSRFDNHTDEQIQLFMFGGYD
jgi:hypothetical protein